VDRTLRDITAVDNGINVVRRYDKVAVLTAAFVVLSCVCPHGRAEEGAGTSFSRPEALLARKLGGGEGGWIVGTVRAIADQPLHAVLRDVLGILRPDTARAQERTQRRAFLPHERNERVRRRGQVRRAMDQRRGGGQGWPRTSVAGTSSSFTRR